MCTEVSHVPSIQFSRSFLFKRAMSSWFICTTASSAPLFIFHLTFFSEVHQEHPRLLCREAQ